MGEFQRESLFQRTDGIIRSAIGEQLRQQALLIDDLALLFDDLTLLCQDLAFSAISRLLKRFHSRSFSLHIDQERKYVMRT